MWNEHCSYKSSKKWLKTLPTKGPRVIQGPGENAGVVDIDDGDCVVFKMESHNHPSYIEPYQGAATGVGGILRDVFTMGARPIAAMNALRFGAPDHPKTRHLVAGVVAGVGGYGNSFGVPTVGGEVEFDPRYNGNILVNAFAAGLAKSDAIFLSEAKGVGLPVVYLGAKTGRDGVGGATMASAEFDESIEEKRPTVQVGDPFTEKCLERMLMVLEPSKEEVAKAIFVKWGLDFAIVGKTTDDLRFRVIHNGEEVANLPIKELGDQAPEYDRPWTAAKVPAPLAENDVPAADIADALVSLVGSANNSSRRWVYEQYDTLIQGKSLQLPGGDAGVVRVEGHDKKALAFSSDVTPRYVEADPFEGGKQAVAECWRNITATGALPLAATDNLNFGNPEKPEIMSQLVHAIKGIGEACRVLEFPIVSGNVSLYNETNGQAILPTPTIGGVGLLKDWGRMARIRFAAADEAVLLVGAPAGLGTHIAQSVYMRDIHGRIDGPAPHVDLAAEKKNGDFVRGIITDGLATAVHDCSSGGLALAVAEMAISSGIGATIDAVEGHNPVLTFYGEDQGRYVLTVKKSDLDKVLAAAKAAGVSCANIGVTGGSTVKLGTARAVEIKELHSAYESWFPQFMDGETLVAAE